VAEGPDLAQDGVTRWRRVDLVRAIKARFGVVMAGPVGNSVFGAVRCH